jgi:hypothetical protein
MKIVQTLWLPEDTTNNIGYKAGWLSAEYHWAAWALSCLLLKQHYSDVELYTTLAGRDILINQLNLPYTKVHIIPENNQINSSNWALAKLLTYYEQTTPFLHVDGDVFIWEPLEINLLNSPLIAQNAETDVISYQRGLEITAKNTTNSFSFLKDSANNNPPVVAYNAGILGGHDIEFLHNYANFAIDFVNNNANVNEQELDSTTYCMIFEQCIFAQMVAEKNKKVSTMFKKLINDISYPGFDDYILMKQKGYWHLMGQFKRNRYNLKMLMSELRHISPEIYYIILKLNKSYGLVLDFKVYQLPELDPLVHSVDYFTSLLNSFRTDYQFDNSIPINWLHYYAKDVFTHQQICTWISLKHTRYEQIFCITHDFVIREETEPIIKQTIIFPDTSTLELILIELDNMTMIILDAFCEQKQSINQVLEIISLYFSAEDVLENKNNLIEIIENRVLKLLFWGVIRLQSYC